MAWMVIKTDNQAWDIVSDSGRDMFTYTYLLHISDYEDDIEVDHRGYVSLYSKTGFTLAIL